MSHPTDDELVDLALGDDVSPEQSAHVAGCDTCAAAVAELHRTARLASVPSSYAGWHAPADAVWERVVAQIDDDETQPVDVEPAHLQAVPGNAPAAESVPPAVPAPAATPTPTPTRADGTRLRRSGRRVSGRRAAWGAALVAASLVVGLLTGRAIWSPDAGGTRVAQVALDTLDTRQREGEATVVRAGNGLDLRIATDRPLDAGSGYLEVWLINADGKRMVSVGVLRPGESGTFPISQALIDQGYVVVDISKEQFDDLPTHSGDSLLRGRLPA